MNHQLKKQSNEQQKAVYYDGSCPMCKAAIDNITNSKQKGKFKPKDINKDPLPQNLTKEQANKEIHVIDSEGKTYKNSEAILKIIEEYPRWKLLAKLGKLPVIKHSLSIGYKFVAANRHFIFGPGARIFWLKIAVASGLIAGLLFSINLWINGRRFPLAPVFQNLPAIPSIIELLLFILLIGLLVATIIFPRPRKFIFPALIIGSIYVFFDQMRLQPWFYQYFFMLATLSLFTWKHADTKKQQMILNTSRLIVASIYFFSGLQKINFTFIEGVFPWMIQPFPDPLQGLLLPMGVFVPFLEMGIGAGLLIARFRKYAIGLAILMLVFVLFTLGPIGHNWNSVVWPWNIAMALFVIILFWRTEKFSPKDVLWVEKFPFHKIVFVLFGIMPVLSFFNLWDSYLSSALYSGNTNNAQIYVSDSVKQKLPQEAQNHTTKDVDGKNALDFFYWSFDELNVPPYPETRVYKAIARDLCRYSNNNDVVLVVDGKPTMFNGDKPSTYDCSDL